VPQWPVNPTSKYKLELGENWLNGPDASREASWMARTAIGFSNILQSLNKRRQNWRAETACLIPPTPRISQAKNTGRHQAKAGACRFRGMRNARSRCEAAIWRMSAPRRPACGRSRARAREHTNEGYTRTTQHERRSGASQEGTGLPSHREPAMPRSMVAARCKVASWCASISSGELAAPAGRPSDIAPRGPNPASL
jgi:hypothetical protein